MKINASKLVICRTPAFSTTQEIKEVWEELKAKIEESSPIFHQLIAHKSSADLINLNDKTKYTIWKYFNRAKFRATPFGSFAAISTFELGDSPIPIVLKKAIAQKHFTDWAEKEKYKSSQFNENDFIICNSTIYTVNNEVRYLRHINGKFELATVQTFPELNLILEISKKIIQIKTLLELLLTKYELSKSSGKKLILQLLGLQLLMTDKEPNITGDDYFEKMKVKTDLKANNYIISQRDHLKGSLNTLHLQFIPELIEFLKQVLPIKNNPNLTDFRVGFNQRFEGKTVNLSVAMDPEIGIGYGNLAQSAIEDELLLLIKQAKPNHEKKNLIEQGKLYQFLLQKLLQNKPIRLEEYAVESPYSNYALPNTFSVMFNLHEAQPVLRHIGGCTANALLGRFTLASQKIYAQAMALSEIENLANPDVVFFDIAYQVENHIDNVNRRKQLYPQELPILTYSTTAEPLTFEDILVSVKGDEIILTSKKLGKRLIPRVASAYNYTRSDLAAYRFLCDLQYQNLLANLDFKLQDYFVDLDYYPRVYFKNIVVSVASWRLPELICGGQNNKPMQKSKFKDWLKSTQINFKFKTGVSDHTLCFDPNKDQDIDAFLHYIGQNQHHPIYLAEALIDDQTTTDEMGDPYVAEYVVNYQHNEKIYSSFKPKNETQITDSSIKLPGEEWLYFEIYGHPVRANQLLLDQINYFTKSNSKLIKEWFFIRYNNPSAHLRLRLLLKDKQQAYLLLNSFQNLMKPLLLSGYLTDISLKTYHRETERYQAAPITLVEEFFAADSKYVLHMLAHTHTAEQLYANALHLLVKLCEIALIDLGDQVNFVHHMASSFAKEMHISAQHFKSINASFEELKRNLGQLTIQIPNLLAQKHIQVFARIIAHCKTKDQLENMLADLIHMHINRLFVADQRQHETIIYHYLAKLLQAKLGRSKAKQE